MNAKPIESVTLMRPGMVAGDSSSPSGALPTDLQQQVRGRVKLLALLLAAAFGIDSLQFLLQLGAAVLGQQPTPAGIEFLFGVIDLAITLASLTLAWSAQGNHVSSRRLLTIGLIYEVLICFAIALLSFYFYYSHGGTIPSLTWVPAIIIAFPLLLPGPPARMLFAAVVSALTPVLALFLVARAGLPLPPTGLQDAYAQIVVSSGLAVGFAYFGARVIYGLGRQISAARELGAYRLEHKLGEGGMGEVWSARHRLLARPAAIKLMRPSLVAGEEPAVVQEIVERFEREAQAIARLSSPHTVRLFDFGVADGGALYYAMELLDGLDADSFVRRFGPMPPERVIHLLKQACHSLSEAESRGLVHRDIKPANIFLCRYGEDCDFVKVLDFGLVKALRVDADQATNLSSEQRIRGTPTFIAPEQAMGDGNIDNRADLYALGCVAYWLLTGQLVFTAGTAMAVMVQHARATAVPPSQRTELAIPAELDALIMACLEKDPADRPQTARELSQRLTAVPLSAPWNEDTARSWWESHGLGRMAGENGG